MGPMPKFMSDREPTAARITALLHGNDRAIIIANDARFTAFKHGLSHLDAD